MVRSCTRLRARVVVSLALAAGLAAPALGADATYRVVARTGQFAPGGGFFSSFGTPTISSNGRVAFKGSVVGVLANRGVWSEGISGMNNLQSVLRKGDAIPGANGTFVDSILPDAGGINMNDSGELAISVPITGTQAQFGDNAILIHTAMGLDSVAVPGQLVSLPCGGFGCQRWMTAISATLFAFNNVGQVGFTVAIDGTGVNSDNEHLLMVSDGVTSEVALREGDTPPGTFGVEFASTQDSIVQLNDQGAVLIRNFLRDVNVAASYWSVWRGQPGSMSIVAAANWLAPVGGTFIGGYVGLGEMAFNDAGQALFPQYVEDEMGVDRMGLWLNSNAPTQSICFDGLPAPLGLTYVYPVSFSGSISPSGAIAFSALVEGPGVTSANNRVLVRRSPFGLQSVLARKGMQAPGLPNGVLFNTVAWSGEQILDDNRVVFRAGLSGLGVTEDNDDSLWITRDGAPPALLIREGQTMVIGGQLKTVDEFFNWLNEGSESGRPTGVSELGQAALRVHFTDGSAAIIVASPEAVCPGDVNGDGLVDFSDLNEMLTEFGHLGDVIDADLDLDGDVDFADLNAVLSNFGVNCN